MKAVFADTLYWVAVVKPTDPWAGPAKCAREKLGSVLLVTTDEVLAEFLALLRKGGPQVRKAAAKTVRAILDNPNVTVVPQTRLGFLNGLDRYEAREDKEYTLTDCISMNVMDSRSISEVLTNDRHFEQEGFVKLIQKDRA